MRNVSTKIESLELEIQSQSTSAVDQLEKLKETLTNLKAIATGGAGLGSIKRQLTSLNTALDTMSDSNIAKLDRLAQGLKAFNGVENIKLSSSLSSQIGNIVDSINKLNGTDLSVVGNLATSLTPLSTIGKSNLNSFISQLKRLPEAFEGLKGSDIETVTTKVEELCAALTPLANQMAIISSGFNALPKNIKNTIAGLNSTTSQVTRSAGSYGKLALKATTAYAAIKSGSKTIAQWINSSNEYVENLNLFTVSMGQYAGKAKNYAETVGEIMGIDPSEWMRNQGIFMTLGTGFGVASDRAYIMSQNLTQLGYDLSSFFNISYEDSMQRLQSGISGELEPLRRLGYDLSAARLQMEAHTLGIQKNVNAMTQAEKAELRYYAIMNQVTSAQGDMARTLSAPSNQLRILQASVSQAARALGNIFIPALNAVLPYAIALMNVIGMLANAIASLFGFSLPTVDYSGLSTAAGGVADSADAIDDSLGGAGKKAKALKNALLGIDELNIISPEEDLGGGGGGSGTGGGGGGGFDFELPTYDFISDALNNKVQDIVNKIKEWLGLTKEINSWTDLMHTRLGHILSIIGSVGIALAGIKAVILIEKLLAKLGTTGGLINTVTGLWGKFTTKLKNLSVFSKVVLSVAALAAEFIAIKSAVQNAIEGNISWGEAALTIIPIAAAVGTAMYLMLGPWGLVLAAVVAVTAAFFGWASAAKQMGIEAYQATEQYEVMAQVISSSEDIIKRSSDALSSVNEKLNGIKSIDTDWFTVRALTDEIYELSEKTNKTDYEMVLLQTKVNTLNDMNIDGLHLSIDETTGAIIEERAAIDKVIEGLELQAKQAALQEVLTEAYKAQYQAMYDNQTAVTNLGAAQETFNDACAEVEKLGSEVKWWMRPFSEEYQAAKAAVDHAKEALILASDAVDSSKSAYDELSGIIENTTEQYALLTKEATDGANAIGGAVTDGMTEGIKTGATEVVSAAEALGNDTSDAVREVLGIHSPSTVFEQMGVDCGRGLKLGLESEMPNVVSVFQGEFVSEAGNKFIMQFINAVRSKSPEFSTVAREIVNSFMTTLTSASEGSRSSMTTWAANLKRWFTDNGSGAINRNTFMTYAKDTITGFNNGISGSYTSSKSIMSTWASNAKSGFTGTVSYSAFYDIAEDVVDGFNNGINAFYSTTKSYMTKWANAAKSAYKAGLDSNSPSMDFWRIGRDTVLGYNLGIIDNGDSTKKVMTNWVNSFENITPTMSFAVDTSALKYYNSDSFAKSVSANVSTNSNISATGFMEAMEEFYKEYVESTINQMADDMRRQADKKEQTNVYIGNRSVSDAVTTQQSANGYRFVTA